MGFSLEADIYFSNIDTIESSFLRGCRSLPRWIDNITEPTIATSEKIATFEKFTLNAPNFSHPYQHRKMMTRTEADAALHFINIKNSMLAFGNLWTFGLATSQFALREAFDGNMRDIASLQVECLPTQTNLHIDAECLLLNPSLLCGNYYHWLIELFPKLLSLLVRGSPVPPLIIVGPETQFQVEALNILGIKPAFRVDPVDIIKLNSVSGLSMVPFREITAVYSMFLENFSTRKKPDGRKIYVSRRGANIRRIVNEDEVLSCLHNYDVQTVTLEGMDLASQIEIFSNASMVVAPHGAGSANLVFASRSTKVLEIAIEERLDKSMGACFWRLANALGLEYNVLFGKKLGFENSIDDGDIQVDISQIKTTISTIVKQPEF